MKKWLSLLLAVAMMMTVVASMSTVSAETTDEPVDDGAEPAFVVDGILDEWYRDDEWAATNNCYFYFNNIDDTTLPVISRDYIAGMGELDLPAFYEEVKVKIYAAYDDTYAYFYVDVDDPNTITSLGTNADGTPNTMNQQMENIDFYIDTDVMSCDGHFNLNEPNYEDADTHFRLIAHNLKITDTQSATKYIFEDQPMKDPADEKKGASNYFGCTENTVALHKKDAAGNITGYICETRVPLAHNYEGRENYSEFYYNIAVTNSATEMDELCAAIATGYRWWLAYDTGKTVSYNVDKPNPFFYPADENQTAADIVGTIINQLTDPEEMEEWEAYTVEEAIDAYNKLTDEQKDLLDPAAYDKLVACAQKVGITFPDDGTIGPPPVPTPTYTPGDVNADDSIDAKDALLVLQAAVKKVQLSDTQMAAAKVNIDDAVDAKDALLILQKAVKKIDKFPCEA